MVSEAYRMGLPSTFLSGANRFIATTGIRLIFLYTEIEYIILALMVDLVFGFCA